MSTILKIVIICLITSDSYESCINFSRLRRFGSIRSRTMKQFAFEFEKHLQQRSEQDSSHDMNLMLSLYEDIKSRLIRTPTDHGYSDLESVFSVEKSWNDRTVAVYDMATAT
jgi:hypothetical protein